MLMLMIVGTVLWTRSTIVSVMYVALLRFAELPISDGGSRVLFVVVVVMLIKVRLCETRVVSILWFSCHVRAAEAFSLHVVDI